MEYRTIKNIKELRVQGVEYYFWREREGMPESIVTVHVGQAVDPAGEWSGPIPTQKEFEMIQGVLEGVDKVVAEKVLIKSLLVRLELALNLYGELYQPIYDMYKSSETLPEKERKKLVQIGVIRTALDDYHAGKETTK